VVKIAGNNGGSKNIDSVQRAFQSLSDLGLTAAQLINIVGNTGGSKNIDSVQRAFQSLSGLGFTAEQVVKIAAHDGGANNIDAVQGAFQALSGLGFTAEQVVKIAAHGGGANNIDAVLHYYNELIACGHTNRSILALSNHNSRSKQIIARASKVHPAPVMDASGKETPSTQADTASDIATFLEMFSGDDVDSRHLTQADPVTTAEDVAVLDEVGVFGRHLKKRKRTQYSDDETTSVFQDDDSDAESVISFCQY
jgi:hypothetical protein